MTLSRNPTDTFSTFLAAFPARPEGHDVPAAREAWARAIGRGADPKTILAGAEAYSRETEGRPPRYFMSAARWLNEGRWRDARARPAQERALVWIPYGSPEWNAWSAHYRASRGKTPPQDKRGGWRFPTPFPPSTNAPSRDATCRVRLDHGGFGGKRGLSLARGLRPNFG